MKPPHSIVTGLALAAAVLTAPVVRAADEFKPTPAPAWTLNDVDGKAVSFDQYKGKVVVLDFWATWCGPCRTEIPGYVELQKKYDKAGLAVVGVSLDQGGPGVVKKFIAEQKINYQIVIGDEQITAAYGGIDAIPTTFIIDRKGTIRYRKVGAMKAEEFEAVLKPFLE